MEIEQQYIDVQHVNAEQFETEAEKQEVVVFDVREEDEFDVSRLNGAIRVSPDISREDFQALFGQQVEGKKLVFYCSVGRRSSDLISRVQDDLFASGASEVYNLEGGIFNWHNEEKRLVNKSGTTDYVHPYSFWWKRSLERPGFASYKPKAD